MLRNAAGIRLKLRVDGIYRVEVSRIAHAVVGNPEAVHKSFQGSEPNQAALDHLLDDRIACRNDPGLIGGGPAHRPLLHPWLRDVVSRAARPASTIWRLALACELMLLPANRGL